VAVNHTFLEISVLGAIDATQNIIERIGVLNVIMLDIQDIEHQQAAIRF
jgi:hypothetical protein